VLAVLAGDGTIRTAAEACTRTDTYLLPLPGGTLNMLSRGYMVTCRGRRRLEARSLLLQSRPSRRSHRR
jgi:hypothetical protein